MRLPWIAAALALALALLAAVLWRGGERAASFQTSMHAASATAPPAESKGPLRVPTLAADGPGTGSGREDSSAARTPVRDEPPTPAQRLASMRVERLIVRGRVRGPVPDLERAALEVRREVGRSTLTLRAHCAVDGSYEIDASELLDPRLRAQGSARFELGVAHPDCMPVVAPFDLSGGRSSEAESGTQFQWTAGTTVCELDVEMVLGTRVRGTLVGVDDPWRFSVVAAALREGRPRPPWLAQDAPDARGEFELVLPPGARYAVVAAGREARPALACIDLLGAAPQHLALALERGAELSGVVRIAPGFPSQGIGVELQLVRDPLAPEPEVWDRPARGLDVLVWIDGAFEWRLCSARTDASGRFAFGGLAPREYDLRALGVGVPGEELRAWPVARLRAPALGATLGPVLASLDLDLGPLADGPLAFELADERGTNSLRLGPYRTDARGMALVHLPPGRDYSVLVASQNVGRISTPAAGEFASFRLARPR